MKKIKKRHMYFGALVLVLAIAAFLVFWLWTPYRPGGIFATGDAVAVATTIPTSFDGLLHDPTSFLDELYFPIGIAVNGRYIIVADSMCDRIQILGDYGNTRIGRPGQFGFAYYDSGHSVDGYREWAHFTKPAGVSLGPDGLIIVADTGNNTIRRICDDFVITIAGNVQGGFADGFEGAARFNQPRAAVMCPDGYIYVADTLNHALRLISPDGYVTTFAGRAGENGFVDGALADARFFEPSGLYLTAAGVLYIADAANHAIRRIENGVVTTVAGRPGEMDRFTGYYEGGYVDGANEIALFNFPRDVALMPNGDILVADSLNHAIRLITPYATRTIVGSGAAELFHYSTENLRLSRPEGVATNGEYMFVSDTINNRVLSIPLTDRVLAGRPSREQMLAETGLSTNARFAYRGDIRVFLGDTRIDFGRVQPWLTPEAIYIPIRVMLEALGADVFLNEATGNLYITIDDTVTMLARDRDYFILRGVMVTTLDEMLRLFPYTLEWFPELSLIAAFVPDDLR